MTFWTLTRYVAREQWRRLRSAGQRSLLVLLLVPLFLLGVGFLYDYANEVLYALLTTVEANQRFGTWIALLGATWTALLIAALTLRLCRSDRGDLPSALAVLPIDRRLLWVALRAQLILFTIAFAASVAVLIGKQAGPSLALYGWKTTFVSASLVPYFLGPFVVAALAMELAGRLGRVLQRSGLGMWIELVVAVTVVGACVLSPDLRERIIAGGTGELLSGLADDASRPWLALVRIATLPTGCALLLFVLSRGSGRESAPSTSGKRTYWNIAGPGWRAMTARDLRLLMRERGGLLTAIAGQALFVLAAAATLEIPVIQRSPGAEDKFLATLALTLPFLWGALAALSFGLDHLGGRQLLSAPLDLRDRTWGKLRAAFAFSLVNWIACIIVLLLVFESTQILAGLGTGLGSLALSVSASFAAGRILPPEMRSSLSGQGSMHTWILAFLFMALGGGAAWGAAQLVDAPVLSRWIQIVVSFATAALYLRGVQRIQLRHGLEC